MGMEEGRVKKSSHCAWQIHYHIVFPVKYRKALLDEDVERIIVETARGIEERYDVEFEQIGCARIIYTYCARRIRRWRRGR